MTISLQGVSTQDTATVNQQKIQDFKDGKINITKKDLGSILSGEITQGQDPSSDLMGIIDSYDKIDKNGDGVSYKEFTTYKSTPAGILSSLGLSSTSINNSINSSLLSYLNNSNSSTSSQQSSLLNSGLFGGNSSDSSTLLDSSSSYLDKLKQSYGISSSETNGKTLSIADYLT